MESCLSGLQFEASSCAAYRLILRACKSGGGAELVVKSAYFCDYVYFWLFSVDSRQKKIAANSIAFIQCRLSDRLLAQSSAMDTEGSLAE